MASVEVRRHITGVVVSAGKMTNTVKVRIPKEVWNKRLQKFYSEPKTLLVSDPTNSTREGDVVALEGGRRISRHVRHVIAGVIAPMGLPLSQRPAVPSAVERLAGVEAKRAAKDIRQAARGRWPAIVRIREREAREAQQVEAGNGVQAAPAIELDMFVKLYRKRREELSLGDFLRVAGYQILQGEVPLKAQSAALNEARVTLRKNFRKLEQQLDFGTTKRTGQALTLHEREQLAKQKLELSERINQLERSLSHFRDYTKQLEEPGARKEYRNDIIQWYDLVKALSMNHWEQTIAALDMFGNEEFRKAESRSMDDVLLRAGVNLEPVKPVAVTPEAAVTPQNTEPEAIDEPVLHASKPKQVPAAVAEDINPINFEAEIKEAKVQSESGVTNDAATEAQPIAIQSAEVKREETQAPSSSATGVEHDTKADAEKVESTPEPVESGEDKSKKTSGFWGIFKGR